MELEKIFLVNLPVTCNVDSTTRKSSARWKVGITVVGVPIVDDIISQCWQG